MALLKRALFGSRRERFRDDPNQQYLFDSKEVNAEEASWDPKADDQETQSRRTSKGRSRDSNAKMNVKTTTVTGIHMILSGKNPSRR